MATPLQLNVGRQRITSVVSPAEAGYVRAIRTQMANIMANMQKIVDHVENVSAEALVYGLKPIFDESQRIVPVDTGRLKRSGFVETRRTARGTAAAIGYGRYGRPTYAAFVHERLDLRHASPTSAKFLELAVARKLDDFRRRVVFFYQKSTGITK